MHVTRAPEAETFELPGVRFTSLAAPRLGSAQLCLWRLEVEPGLETPEAHTIDRDEAFVVVAGTVRLTPGGAELEAGDAAVVPAGAPIRLVNAGAGAAILHVAVQAGFTATMADGAAVGTPPWAA
jgi:quercetin dioxygenase-like cupin family protein